MTDSGSTEDWLIYEHFLHLDEQRMKSEASKNDLPENDDVEQDQKQKQKQKQEIKNDQSGDGKVNELESSDNLSANKKNTSREVNGPCQEFETSSPNNCLENILEHPLSFIW